MAAYPGAYPGAAYPGAPPAQSTVPGAPGNAPPGMARPTAPPAASPGAARPTAPPPFGGPSAPWPGAPQQSQAPAWPGAPSQPQSPQAWPGAEKSAPSNDFPLTPIAPTPGGPADRRNKAGRGSVMNPPLGDYPGAPPPTNTLHGRQPGGPLPWTDTRKKLPPPPAYDEAVAVNEPVMPPAPPPYGPPDTAPPPGKHKSEAFMSYPAIISPEGDHMEVTQCDVLVEIHVGTAFVTYRVDYENKTKSEVNGVLVVPTNHTSTISSVAMQVGKKMYDTMIVPNTEALAYNTAQKEKAGVDQVPLFATADPDNFSMPVMGIGAGERVKVSVTYFEPMVFWYGSYSITVPFDFGDYQRSGAARTLVQGVIGTQNNRDLQWGSTSHSFKCVSRDGGRLSIQSVGAVTGDIELHYNVWSDNITAHCIVEDPDPNSYDPRGSFVCFVGPPNDAAAAEFPRSVVFLLDQSYSMYGDPMIGAREAVAKGISMLRPQDQFAVVGFDHALHPWQTHLVDASAANVQEAMRWVRNVEPTGGTDILEPIMNAVGILERKVGVPYIFVVTDGAVANEREICVYVRDCVPEARVMTFGIGPYCNTYFLKMLALLGRGYAESALYPEEVEPRMTYLFSMASKPVLVDAELTINGVQDKELYPYPIPDLFTGAPLVVSGKFNGRFPDSIVLTGKGPNGERMAQTISVSRSEYVPVSRVFVKFRLDILTAQAWLTESEELKQAVIDLSVQEGMPSAHTTMVAYETNDELQEEKKKNEAKGGGGVSGSTAAMFAVGGVAGIVVLGVAAYSFGNISATSNNHSTADSLRDRIGRGMFNGNGGPNLNFNIPDPGFSGVNFGVPDVSGRLPDFPDAPKLDWPSRPHFNMDDIDFDFPNMPGFPDLNPGMPTFLGDVNVGFPDANVGGMGEFMADGAIAAGEGIQNGLQMAGGMGGDAVNWGAGAAGDAGDYLGNAGSAAANGASNGMNMVGQGANNAWGGAQGYGEEFGRNIDRDGDGCCGGVCSACTCGACDNCGADDFLSGLWNDITSFFDTDTACCCDEVTNCDCDCELCDIGDCLEACCDVCDGCDCAC